MLVYICVYVRVSVCVFECLCMYVCLNISVCMWLCACLNVLCLVCIFVFVWMCLCVRLYKFPSSVYAPLVCVNFSIFICMLFVNKCVCLCLDFCMCRDIYVFVGGCMYKFFLAVHLSLFLVMSESVRLCICVYLSIYLCV